MLQIKNFFCHINYNELNMFENLSDNHIEIVWSRNREM